MLFEIKQEGILGELTPLALQHKQLIDSFLYKRIPGDILYNHCFEYLYSYFANVKAAYFTSLEENEMIVVTKKNKTEPKYSVHCPLGSAERLRSVFDQLSKLSKDPVRAIDLNDAQTTVLQKLLPGRWVLHKMGKDVIFDLTKCCALSGGDYKGIRNGINNFTKNVQHSIKVMNTEKTAQDACMVIQKWKETQGKKYFRVTTGRDVEVFKRFWPIVDNKNVFGYVVYNGENEPIGATLGCRSAKREDFGMEITTKVLPEYRGLTDYLSWVQFKDMRAQGILFTNEAGIYSPGIRFNKEKWHPVDYFQMFDLEWIP